MDALIIRQSAEDVAYIARMCRVFGSAHDGIDPYVVNDLRSPDQFEMLERAVEWLVKRHWTLEDIKQANNAAGFHFFSPSTMKAFKSRVYPGDVYQSSDGRIYFLTSESTYDDSGRDYRIREFDPTVGNIRNSDPKFKTLSAARRYVRKLVSK